MARPPSPESPISLEPATVVMTACVPAPSALAKKSMRRTRDASAMSSEPAASTAQAEGALRVAVAAGPPSPALKSTPRVPAMTVAVGAATLAAPAFASGTLSTRPCEACTT